MSTLTKEFPGIRKTRKKYERKFKKWLSEQSTVELINKVEDLVEELKSRPDFSTMNGKEKAQWVFTFVVAWATRNGEKFDNEDINFAIESVFRLFGIEVDLDKK